MVPMAWAGPGQNQEPRASWGLPSGWQGPRTCAMFCCSSQNIRRVGMETEQPQKPCQHPHKGCRWDSMTWYHQTWQVTMMAQVIGAVTPSERLESPSSYAQWSNFLNYINYIKVFKVVCNQQKKGLHMKKSHKIVFRFNGLGKVGSNC